MMPFGCERRRVLCGSGRFEKTDDAKCVSATGTKPRRARLRAGLLLKPVEHVCDALTSSFRVPVSLLRIMLMYPGVTAASLRDDRAVHTRPVILLLPLIGTAAIPASMIGGRGSVVVAKSCSLLLHGSGCCGRPPDALQFLNCRTYIWSHTPGRAGPFPRCSGTSSGISSRSYCCCRSGG